MLATSEKTLIREFSTILIMFMLDKPAHARSSKLSDMSYAVSQVSTQVDWKTTFEGSNRAEVNQKNV